jgi:hypothetical protein
MNILERTKQRLGIIWLLFAAIFASLGAYHYVQSTKSIEEFTFVHRPGGGSLKVMGMDLDAPFDDFSKKFNVYIENQNTSSSTQNLASFAGYIAATLTALLSAAIELFSKRDHSNNETESHSDQSGDDKRPGILDEKDSGEAAEETRHAQDDSDAKVV